MIAAYTPYRNGLVKHTTLAVASLLWMAGCATSTSGLRKEIKVLLEQTMDEVRQETGRMDTELAQLRSEVVQLRSAVGQADSKVGRVGAEVRQLGSEVSLIQTDMRKNDTSLVDLAVRVNQLDRRVAKGESQSPQNGERVSRAADGRGSAVGQPMAATAVSSPPEASAKALKRGMPQQEVLRLFGNPHSEERILDSIYWYYADGELKGQYVRFDATTGSVNGWSIFSPEHFQIDLRTTQEGHRR